eukprot:1156329-Pelagomonas_calceolata.AAC.11
MGVREWKTKGEYGRQGAWLRTWQLFTAVLSVFLLGGLIPVPAWEPFDLASLLVKLPTPNALSYF